MEPVLTIEYRPISQTQSPFSPFIDSLILSDLPSNIQASHITQILSKRQRGGRVSESRDHGISLLVITLPYRYISIKEANHISIRIYTIPRTIPKPLISRLLQSTTSRKSPLKTKKGSPDTTPSYTAPPSPTFPHQSNTSPGSHSRVVEVEDDVEVTRGSSLEVLEEIEEEDEVTVAELRFTDLGHRMCFLPPRIEGFKGD